MFRAKTLGPGKTQSCDIVTVSPLARSETRPKPVTALFFRFPSPGFSARDGGCLRWRLCGFRPQMARRGRPAASHASR